MVAYRDAPSIHHTLSDRYGLHGTFYLILLQFHNVSSNLKFEVLLGSEFLPLSFPNPRPHGFHPFPSPFSTPFRTGRSWSFFPCGLHRKTFLTSMVPAGLLLTTWMGWILHPAVHVAIHLVLQQPQRSAHGSKCRGDRVPTPPWNLPSHREVPSKSPSGWPSFPIG